MNSILQKALSKAFPSLSDKVLQMVFDAGKMIYSPAKNCITGPNDGDNSMYICLSGVVKINYESSDGEELSITYLSQGEIFGELSAIDEQTRSAYCIAKTDCSLLKVPSKAVRDLLNDNAEFNKAVIEVLVKRIRDTDDKLFSVGKHTATERIIREISRLAKPVKEGSDEYEIPFSPTHQEIALLAIVSREQTTRTMKKLQNQGLYEKTESGFHIPSITAFKEAEI